MTNLLSLRTIVPGLMIVLVLTAAVWMGISEYDFRRGHSTFGEDVNNIVGYGLLGTSLVLLALGLLATTMQKSRTWIGVATAIGGAWTAAVLTYWLIVPFLIAAGITAFVVWHSRRKTDIR